MRNALHILFLSTVVAILIGLVSVALGLTIARIVLPASACEVSEKQVDALQLEMSYAEVRSALGCDGVRRSHQDLGAIQIERMVWRGSDWPYSLWEGQFINGVLHGTTKTWLSLSLSTSGE